MPISSLVFMLVGGALVIVGLISVITRKVFFMGSNADMYTEESLRRYALPAGFSNILAGAALILYLVFESRLVKLGSIELPAGLTALIVLGIASAAIAFGNKKLLVIKQA